MAVHKLSLSVCLLLLCNGLLALASSAGLQNQCNLDNLNAIIANKRFESEGGVSEFWDPQDDQLQCAGVNVGRHIIQPRGLFLPEYGNAPRLSFVAQGRGILGAAFPGCPETFQSVQRSRRFQYYASQKSSDQHQKLLYFRQGDVLALPVGISLWIYNNGEKPLVMITLYDTGNYANQLDQDLQTFSIAGNAPKKSSPQYERGYDSGHTENADIFAGLDVNTIAKTYRVSKDTARKLQAKGTKEGQIIQLEKGLQLVSPLREEEEEEEEEEKSNGLEERFCYMRLRENIEDANRADVYNRKGGRLTILNSRKLPILRHLQLNAQRGILYPNALVSPHWTANAHSIVYVTRGNARVQIVNGRGRAVFDSQVQEGQLFLVPQEFTVAIEAGNNGFEWVAFKTNDNAITNTLAGKTSVIRALPEEVLMHGFGLSREEARSFKYNRDDEIMILSPTTKSQGYASA